MPVWFDVPNAGFRPSHDQIAFLQEGRLIAVGKNYVVATFSSGCEVLNVRIPDLRHVEYVLDVEFNVDPLNCSYPIYEAVNKKITGNVVGMTIFGAAYSTGTTLMVEVIAVGPP